MDLRDELPCYLPQDRTEYCTPPHRQERIYSLCRQISVSCLLRADYELRIFFLLVWLLTNIENFPARKPFANSLMMGIFGHDMRKWERTVPPANSCSCEGGKSPGSPGGCWPLQFQEEGESRGKCIFWGLKTFSACASGPRVTIIFLVEFPRSLASTAISRLSLLMMLTSPVVPLFGFCFVPRF